MLDDDQLHRDKQIHLHSKYPTWEKDVPTDMVDKVKKFAAEKYEMTEDDPCKTCGVFCMKDYLLKPVLDKLYRGELLDLGNGHDFNMEYEEEDIQRAMRNGAYKAFQHEIDKMTDNKMQGLLPECIVNQVRLMFPSPAGIYHGWPWVEKELEQLGEDPVEYVKTEQITVTRMIESRKEREKKRRAPLEIGKMEESEKPEVPIKEEKIEVLM